MYLMTFHQIAAGHTFFSSAHRTFSRIDFMIGHKSQQIQEDNMGGPMGVNTKYEKSLYHILSTYQTKH